MTMRLKFTFVILSSSSSSPVVLKQCGFPSHSFNPENVIGPSSPWAISEMQGCECFACNGWPLAHHRVCLLLRRILSFLLRRIMHILRLLLLVAGWLTSIVRFETPRSLGGVPRRFGLSANFA